MRRALAAAAFLAIPFVGCGGTQPAVAPPPSSSATLAPARPRPDDGAPRFAPPSIAEARLGNGLRVLVVERHDQPRVSMLLTIATGAGDVPEGRPGLMWFLGKLLEQGTKKRDARQLDAELDALGAARKTWVAWDAAGVSVQHVRSDKLDEGLELMADMALAPSFPDAEIERLRARRIGAIRREHTDAAEIAANTVAAALYGRAHPYGHSIAGEEEPLKGISRAEIVGAYDRLFTPTNAAIVVVGDVALATVLPKLEATFGAWKPSATAFTRTPPAAPARPAAGRRIVFVHHPGPQSLISFARVGPAFGVRERDALILANRILGSMPTSRVNRRLRDNGSYTAGVQSYFLFRHGAGPFLLHAPVPAEKTGAAIKDVLSEIDALRRDAPTEEELARAKEQSRKQLPASFASIDDTSAAVADLVTYDLPLDEYAKLLPRIDAVSAADVTRAATEYFASDAMTVVVVGDRNSVLPQLEALGLGAVEERDTSGDPAH